MEKRTITVSSELGVNGKKLILVSGHQDLLLDKENPYFSALNKENKLLVFALWEKIHYGILVSNLLSILEEKLGVFIGSVFKGVKGITDDLFDEDYFIYLMGKDKENRKRWRAIKKEVCKKQKDEDGRSPLSYTPHFRRAVDIASDEILDYTSATSSVYVETPTAVNTMGVASENANAGRVVEVEERVAPPQVGQYDWGEGTSDPEVRATLDAERHVLRIRQREEQQREQEQRTVAQETATIARQRGLSSIEMHELYEQIMNRRSRN